MGTAQWVPEWGAGVVAWRRAATGSVVAGVLLLVMVVGVRGVRQVGSTHGSGDGAPLLGRQLLCSVT